MVIFDTNFMLFLLQDDLPAPEHPESGEIVERCEDRISHLVSLFQKDREKIIIPTPVLSEILVRADEAAPSYVSKINKSPAFRLEPFDTRAAIEVSLMTARAIKTGDKKDGSDESWTKVKYDRQIIGIALACGITTIYTNDKNLKNLAEKKNITIIGVHELELPPQDPPTLFDWDTTEQTTEKPDEPDE